VDLVTIAVIPAALLGAMVLFRCLRFVTTPLLRRMGIYRYYSPMFLTVPFGVRTLELHLGTAWDFFRRRNLNQLELLMHLGRGLLALLEAVDRGEVRADTRLRGTMCFLSTETMQKIGFQTRPMNVLEGALFLLNYPEICLLQSLVKGRVCLVNLNQVRMFKASVHDLLRTRDRLVTVVDLLERRCNSLSRKRILAIKPGSELPTRSRRLTSTTGDNNEFTYDVWRSVDSP